MTPTHAMQSAGMMPAMHAQPMAAPMMHQMAMQPHALAAGMQPTAMQGMQMHGAHAVQGIPMAGMPAASAPRKAVPEWLRQEIVRKQLDGPASGSGTDASLHGRGDADKDADGGKGSRRPFTEGPGMCRASLVKRSMAYSLKHASLVAR